ncbi:MAG TPA: (2Fe-2S)-binding protein [Terriglobales bacterium]|nr:(2Fe-2S)-binding protein [Terriglobales bacterium]
MAGLFQRLQDQQRTRIEIIVDGDRIPALEGDTLLTAILLNRPHLRRNEVDDEPRSGFCLMGACQDCWISDSDGNRLRACSTYVRAGLEIVTGTAAAAIATATQPPVPDDVAETAPSPEATSGAPETERKTEGDPSEDMAEDDPAEEGHS